MIFEEKYFPCYVLLTDQISLSGCNIFIVYQTGCDITNFEINLVFLMKPFFLQDQKVKTIIKIS